jgi:hypothetical protein
MTRWMTRSRSPGRTIHLPYPLGVVGPVQTQHPAASWRIRFRMRASSVRLSRNRSTTGRVP